MKKYSYLNLLCLVLACCVLFACEKASEEAGDCPYAPGCKLQGENFYLVEHAMFFPSLELCRERIKDDAAKYGVSRSYQDGADSTELFITGGFDDAGENFKFICQKRYYEPGFVYYFSKEGQAESQ